MKKFLVFFLALSLLGGFAFANDLGLTAGLDFGINELNNDANDSAMDTAFIRPTVVYENSFGDVDLYAELGIPFWVNPEFWLGIELKLEGAYNLALTSEGTLSFILGSEIFISAVYDEDKFVFPTPTRRSMRYIAGLYTADDVVEAWVMPGVKYTHALSDFSIFGQVNVPLLLASCIDALDYVGLDFILGFNMTNGFGLEVEIANWLQTPMEETDMFHHVWITPSFETGPIYAELEVGIPTYEDGIKFEGVTIIPEFRYMIMDNFQAYLNLPIQGIASDNDVVIGLGLGARFSF